MKVVIEGRDYVPLEDLLEAQKQVRELRATVGKQQEEIEVLKRALQSIE